MIEDLDPPSFQFPSTGGGAGDDPGPEAEAAKPIAKTPPAPTQGEEEQVDAPDGRRTAPRKRKRARAPDGKRARTPYGIRPTTSERKRGPDLELLTGETARRVLWAVPWTIFAIAVITVGGLAFTAAMIAFALVGVRELYLMAGASRPLMLPGFLAVAALGLAAHFGDSFQMLLVFAASFPLIFAFAAAREDHDRITVSIAVTVLGVAWLGIAFAHVILLRDLPDHGGALVIDVLLATFIGDTTAYAGGRTFGTRRLSPRISPSKTVEGMIAGILGATSAFWIAGLYQDWLSGPEALLIGLAVGLLAPVGDLFASMIKRDWGAKDSGHLFGPHGGLIDRFDAATFTVVAGYYLALALVY